MKTAEDYCNELADSTEKLGTVTENKLATLRTTIEGWRDAANKASIEHETEGDRIHSLRLTGTIGGEDALREMTKALAFGARVQAYQRVLDLLHNPAKTEADNANPSTSTS